MIVRLRAMRFVSASVFTVAASGAIAFVGVACGSSSANNASADASASGNGGNGDDSNDGGTIGVSTDGSSGGNGGTGSGGNGGSGDDGGTAATTVDEATYASSLCNLYTPCCSAAGDTAPSDACAAAQMQMHQTGAVYNPTAGAACLTAARAASSSGTLCGSDDGTPFDVFGVCNSVYVVPASGTRELGSACTQTSDCLVADGGITSCNLTIENDGGEVTTCLQILVGKDGSHPCIDDTGNTGNLPTPPATAYSCAQSAGLFCDQTSGGCSPLKATSGGCEDDSQCVVGDYCGTVQTSLQCTPRIALGQECADGTGCVTTAYCDMVQGTCAKLLANGQQADSPSDCASGLAPNGTCISQATYTLGFFCK